VPNERKVENLTDRTRNVPEAPTPSCGPATRTPAHLRAPAISRYQYLGRNAVIARQSLGQSKSRRCMHSHLGRRQGEIEQHRTGGDVQEIVSRLDILPPEHNHAVIRDGTVLDRRNRAIDLRPKRRRRQGPSFLYQCHRLIDLAAVNGETDVEVVACHGWISS
jgi:hypothetical protein